MNRIRMKGTDLGELYGLLKMYGQTYHIEVYTLLKQIQEDYEEAIENEYVVIGNRSITNPRGAGRKSQVTEAEKEQAALLSSQGYSIREIGKNIGRSPSYVYKLLH